jgi:hypothetical protein
MDSKRIKIGVFGHVGIGRTCLNSIELKGLGLIDEKHETVDNSTNIQDIIQENNTYLFTNRYGDLSTSMLYNSIASKTGKKKVSNFTQKKKKRKK